MSAALTGPPRSPWPSSNPNPIPNPNPNPNPNPTPSPHQVGRELEVLVDRMEGEDAIARTQHDALDIDGTVRILATQVRVRVRVG